jgi:hypothetical protein
VETTPNYENKETRKRINKTPYRLFGKKEKGKKAEWQKQNEYTKSK